MTTTKGTKTSRAPRASLALLACAATAAWATSAGAQESPYCAKVHARAAADSALLLAPSVRAEGIKLPKGGSIEPTNNGSGYQLRAGITVNPLDMYKSVRVVDLGEADCQQHEAVTVAQDLLLQAAFFGRLPALRKQKAFLDDSRPRWEAVIAKVDERLAAKLTTLLEADDVHLRADALERSREQVVGEIERLQAGGIGEQRVDLNQMVKSVEAKSMAFEQKASHIRSLDAWDVHVTGGYVPAAFGQPADFFGVVSVSFNVGSPWRNAAETRYVAARHEEVTRARYETLHLVEAFRAQLRTVGAQANREIAIVDRRIAALTSGRTALTSADAPGAPHALAVVDLELITAESDRVFLKALAEEIARMEEKS